MTKALELPCDLDGLFSIYLYLQSHGQLLLRSVNRAESPKRVELLFKDTIWMSLPAWMHGLRIENYPISSLLPQLPEQLRKDAIHCRAYRLTSEGMHYHLIAGSVFVSRDELEYFDQSGLLPDVEVTWRPDQRT